MPEIEINGTRLYYQQSGEGPDVVLVHAVTSNQAVWVFSGLVDALASDFRVTSYDLRGHGRSERSATGYTSAGMAEDFRQLHAALGLKPACLVGHSFGGVVSMHAAALAPECVKGVLLSDSFFPGLKHIEPNFGRMNIWAELRENFAKVGVTLGETVDFDQLFRETAALSPENMKALEQLYGTFGTGWLRHLPKLAETTCGQDVMREAGLTADVLKGIQQPVVALYDEFSPFLATCRWLEQHLPRCTAEIIPAAKHLAMFDNTAGFTEAVKRHLTQLTRGLMYFVAFILKNLTRRPIRTVLTVLGLAVAVGSMIALLGVSDNVEKSVEAAFDTRRVDLIVMQKNKPMGLDSDFSEYFVQETAKMPEVARVSEGVVSNANMQRANGFVDDTFFLVQGWKPDNFGFEDIDLIDGRLLQADDTHKVMLGTKLATNLNKKVGDTFIFVADDKHPYEVIAVFKSKVVFEEGGAIVSFKDGQALTGKKVTGFSIRVKRNSEDATAEVQAVKQKVAALRDPKDPTVQLDAQSPEVYVQSVQQLKLIRAVSWLVSVIAFVIGVITMLNTMAMSVLERTQEIGILRAVGWPRGRVIRMILGEAVLLSLAAAAAGTAVAIGGLYALTRSPKVNGFIEPGLSPWVIVVGTAITVFIGVVGGLYPAFRAAQLLPTEAIRHD